MYCFRGVGRWDPPIREAGQRLKEALVARVTIEDCLEQLNNRFALVILGAERARQLAKGAHPLVDCTNKPAVTALREIAAEKVHFNEDVHSVVVKYLDDQKNQQRTDAPK